MFFRNCVQILLVYCLFHAVFQPISAQAQDVKFVENSEADQNSSSHFLEAIGKTATTQSCSKMDMSRYTFIRDYYPILRFLADCYFTLLDAVFSLINAFEPIEHVGWQNASELLFIPGNKAAELIRKDKLTSTDLVSAYISRLKEVNPLLNAIAHTNYDAALKEAEKVDSELAKMTADERNALAKTKPLFGVPFTSKDNLKTKGFVTGAGNRYLIKGGPVATEDAPVVKRMRDAGAILLAISTLPNLALSWAGDDTGYGVTNNPHDSRRVTGGSSAGEGALIGAGASLCGIGNDIGGSIRIPANMNGVFGLRPTSFPDHVVPTDGIVPASLTYKPAENMLSNGPLCRYATDLPLALSVLSGKNVSSYELNVDFAKDFKLFYLEDIHILLSQELKFEQRMQVRKVKSYFEEKYNLNVQKVEFPLLSRMLELFYSDPWSPGIPSVAEVKTMFDQIYTGVANATFFGWQFEALKRFASPKTENEKTFAAGKRIKLRQQVANLLGKNGLLLTPVWPTGVPFHHMEPFSVFNVKYTMMVNVLGFPALTAPTGLGNTHMPVGVQLVSAPFNEALLIAAAKEMERGFGGWVKPGQQRV
ncbi:hypothetical protein GPALN_003368 [Globodera pallida]|nr:hypothetical protein GPALN_003368 [Globodera pallida]